VGFAASLAQAQCSFEHPKKAVKLQSNLVQAFVSCGNVGGNSPNTNTEGGVPTCQPPETFNEQQGSPTNGWLWTETKSQGKVAFKAKAVCTAVSTGTTLPACNPASPLNTGPPASADLEVKLDLKAVEDALSAPLGDGANGPGSMSTVARATLNDRAGGDMTVIDFPADFPFALVDGKAKLKTSADSLLNAISQPGLPPCSSIEVVSIIIEDENGNGFASMGTFLPPLAP
jgi:hypothetical protein